MLPGPNNASKNTWTRLQEALVLWWTHTGGVDRFVRRWRTAPASRATCGQRFPNVDTEFNRVWGDQLGNTSMNLSQCPCRGGPLIWSREMEGKNFRGETFIVSMGRRRLWRFNKRNNETSISTELLIPQRAVICCVSWQASLSIIFIYMREVEVEHVSFRTVSIEKMKKWLEFFSRSIVSVRGSNNIHYFNGD